MRLAACVLRRLRAGRSALGVFTPALIVALAAIVAACCTALVPTGPDYLWSYDAGAWTLAHGRVLETLAGSWYPQRPWVDQEWLYTVLTAWAVAHHAYVAVTLLIAVSAAATIVFVLGESIRSRAHPVLACVQVGVTSLATMQFVQHRAQTLVMLLAPALILVWRSRPWLCAPIVLLWTNLHGSYPLAIGWLATHARRKTLLPLALAAAVTLLNPVGAKLWLFSVSLSSNPEIANYLIEWRHSWVSLDLALAVVVALAPLWVRLLGGGRLRRPARVGDLLWIAGTAALAIDATRHVFELAITLPTAAGNAMTGALHARAKLAPLAAALFVVAIVALEVRIVLWVAPVVPDARFDFFVPSFSMPTACVPDVSGENVFADQLYEGSAAEFAGAYANIDGRVDAFAAGTIADANAVRRGARSAERIVDGSRAQVLALAGTFRPDVSRWGFVRRCGPARFFRRLPQPTTRVPLSTVRRRPVPTAG